MKTPRFGQADQPGFALIAVLVALSILLALTAPFLTSMGNGAEVARQAGAEVKADLASRSVRDYLLARASAEGDVVGGYDDLGQYPTEVDLPAGFAAVSDRGRMLLGGSVEDVQRRFDVNTASPLLLSNLIGTNTRLRKKLTADAEEVVVDNASGFPDEGEIFVDGEVIAYASRTDTEFQELTRGQMLEFGRALPEEHEPDANTRVMDVRCMLAASWSFLRDGDFSTRKPLTRVADLRDASDLRPWPFDAVELGVFEQFGAARSFLDNGATFGHGARVFGFFENERQQRVSLVSERVNAMTGGTLVRLRSGDGESVEYNLVWRVRLTGRAGLYNVGGDRIELLWPVGAQFEAGETVIEPLVPVPVNVNTAEPGLLAALFANLSASLRIPDGSGGSRVVDAVMTPAMAEQHALDIVALRAVGLADAGDGESGPFEHVEDFFERYWQRFLSEESSPELRGLYVRVSTMLLHGWTTDLQEATLPITFSSGPLVRYRAAAARRRVSGIEDSRIERSGIALAMSDRSNLVGAGLQLQFEELIRFDRHSAYWTTGPIYVGVKRGVVEPPTRTFAHVLPYAYPGAGLGKPRFPDRDGEDASLRPVPAETPFGGVQGAVFVNQLLADNPDGRMLQRQGPETVRNSGPRASGAGGGRQGGDRSQAAFDFSEGDGLWSRQAISFWVRLDDYGDQGLAEIIGTDGDPVRNRIAVELVGGELVFQVFDEAGFDPDSGVVDTQPSFPVASWRVSIAELGFGNRDWMHVSFGVDGSKPSQLMLLIDGVPRGRPDHLALLDTEIPASDVNQDQFELDRTADGNRFVRVTVDDAENFPPRGVVKVGPELFEYTSIAGNALVCTYDDSFGGRAARTDFPFELVRGPLAENSVDYDAIQELLRAANGGNVGQVPRLPRGSAAELYGYSLPTFARLGYPLQQGEFGLLDDLGAFCVARVVNRSSDAELISDAAVPFPLGVGFLANGQTNDIVLADPVATPDIRQANASDEVLSAFPQSGGFIVMCQREVGFGNSQFTLGGFEVMSYAARQGDRLTGVIRNQGQTIGLNNSVAGNFVTEWSVRVLSTGQGAPPTPVDPNEFDSNYTYVFPISIAVARPPAQSDHTEWVQLRDGGNDSNTEWVRYNVGARK